MEKHAPRKDRAGWLPRPRLSVLIATVWLLLQQSLSVPNLIVALGVGLIVPRLVQPLLGAPARPRRPLTALRFVGRVLWDVVVSNFTVARIVVTPWRRPHPAWVTVPLDIQDPTAVTLLAAVITTTPGTVSCVIDEDRGIIYVHALDCDDPAAMAADIKQRYEQPLKEIFEWHLG